MERVRMRSAGLCGILQSVDCIRRREGSAGPGGNELETGRDRELSEHKERKYYY